MNIKTTLLCSFLLISGISNHILAQESHSISGVVTSESGTVPFASVILRSLPDSTVYKVALTDTTGKFMLKPIANGSYFLTVSMVGYADYQSRLLEISGNDLILETINLNYDGELSAINVSAVRPVIEVHPDKTVFNVEGTLNATGANGFELLRKAPGVIIDNSNNIVLEGKSGVQIYIDNKLTQLAGDDLINFLMSLQAADIDNIEIITQPSSKYDAAGNAGIINIILKRDKNMGTNGTLTAGYGYGKNHHLNSSVSLNHRSKKANVYAAYSNNFGKNYMFFFMDRTQFGYLYESRTESNNYMGAHNGRVGVDWFLNKKHTLGVQASGNYFENNQDGLNTTNIGPVGFTTPQQILYAHNTGDGLNYQWSGNVNYRFADTSGHEFSMDVDYGVYDRESNAYQPNEYRDGITDSLLYENNYRMITPTTIDIFTAKADYSQNLLGGKVSLGLKYSQVVTDNTLEFYDVVDGTDIYNTGRSNEFAYTENINAGYLNYARQINQKLNFQVGIRAEQTNSLGVLTSSQSTALDSVDRQYLNWFPSGGFTYTPNFNNIWSLTFSRRIQRPNYQSLNPFTWQVNELSYMQGNPFLQPKYANNVRVSHTFKYRFNTSLSYSYVEDFFAQISDTLGLTQSTLTTKNVADEQTINLGVSLPFSIKNWWNVFISVNAFHTSYIGTDDKFQAVDRFTGSFFGQNTFLLPAGFKFEVSGWFSSPSIWGGTYLTKSMGAIDLAIEKRFFDERLSLRLSGSDIFYTAPWRAEMEYGELSISGSGGWESRIFRFNLSYNFGNKDVKKIRERKTGLEDEKERTGESGGQ